MKSWRQELQKELDTNNTLRQSSIYRVGDTLTETKSSLEGAGRARSLFAEISEGFSALKSERGEP